jgi:Leucine-rich repeat (LRR) protein
MVNIEISDIKNFAEKSKNSKEAIDLLISVLEKSENIETRLEVLKVLSELQLHGANKFKVFENFLVSDAHEGIRAFSVEIIFQNFIEKGLDAVDWAILNDPSPKVLSKIKTLIRESKNPFKLDLQSTLFNRFKIIAQKYKLDVGEVPFLIDIGIKITQQNFYIGNQDFYFIYEKDILCIVKKEHIREVGIFFLKEVPDSIGNLSKLEHLDLSYGYIKSLPNSLIQLRNLKSIDLTFNEIIRFPEVFKSIKSLEDVNLSNNPINFIPKWAHSIKNLKM